MCNAGAVIVLSSRGLWGGGAKSYYKYNPVDDWTSAISEICESVQQVALACGCGGEGGQEERAWMSSSQASAAGYCPIQSGYEHMSPYPRPLMHSKYQTVERRVFSQFYWVVSLIIHLSKWNCFQIIHLSKLNLFISTVLTFYTDIKKILQSYSVAKLVRINKFNVGIAQIFSFCYCCLFWCCYRHIF